MSPGRDERMRRWRLVLGAADSGADAGVPLTGDDARIDAALGALYDSDERPGLEPAGKRQVGLGASAPAVELGRVAAARMPVRTMPAAKGARRLVRTFARVVVGGVKGMCIPGSIHLACTLG